METYTILDKDKNGMDYEVSFLYETYGTNDRRCAIIGGIKFFSKLKNLEIDTFHIPSVFKISPYETIDVTHIGENVFDCNNWSSIFIDITCIDSGILYIEGRAFQNSNIKKIIWPDTCPKIRPNTFANSSVKEIIGIEKAEEVLPYAFATMPYLERINWPEACTVVPKCVFLNDSKLSIIDGLDKIEEIHDEAFKSSGIEGFIIPNTCHMIGKNSFGFCENLNKVEANPANFISVFVDSFDYSNNVSVDLTNRKTIRIIDGSLSELKKHLGERYVENLYFPIEI